MVSIHESEKGSIAISSEFSVLVGWVLGRVFLDAHNIDSNQMTNKMRVKIQDLHHAARILATDPSTKLAFISVRRVYSALRDSIIYPKELAKC